MKFHLLAALAVASLQAAPTVESVKSEPFALPSFPRFAATRAPAQAAEPGEGHGPLFLDPNLAPLLRDGKLGDTLATMSLPNQLDRHRALVRLRLGSRDWDLSVAGDAAFKTYYVALRDGADIRLAPLGDVNRLRHEGVDIQVDPGVVYNLHLSINIFNPIRGSTLELRPTRGTQGPRHDLKTGTILDAVRDRSLVFSADGAEYWGLYGTDVDPAAGKLAHTRSFLFVHLDGLNTKAWPLAEGALTPGQPYRVDFKSALALTRGDDALVIAKPR